MISFRFKFLLNNLLLVIFNKMNFPWLQQNRSPPRIRRYIAIPDNSNGNGNGNNLPTGDIFKDLIAMDYGKSDLFSVSSSIPIPTDRNPRKRIKLFK